MNVKISFWLVAMICFAFADTQNDWLDKGKKCVANKQYKQATQYFLKIIEQNSNHFAANYHLFECYAQTNQNSKATTYLKKACLIKPSYKIYWQLGNFTEKHHDDNTAEEAYKECLKHSNDAQIYRRLSIVLEAQGNHQDAWQYRVEGVALELPKVRGFKFKSKTPAGVKNRVELKEFLLEELEKELPAQDAETYMLTLLSFNMLSEPLDIKSLYISLLTEQIGGFYNPETKRLYLIAEPKKSSLWEQWFPLTRNDADDRMVLAHEMTHAVQDQYYDLMKLQQASKNDDDISLALTSLIEGDATLAMLDYNQWPKRVQSSDEPAFRASFGFMQFLMPFVGGDELAKCPTIMRESLMFPYIDGFFFCLKLRDSSFPWKNINSAYQDPPKSTEQILHPHKYKVDHPLDFDFDHKLLETKNWKIRATNVMGEFGIRCFLKDLAIKSYKKIAAGWGGDRYFLMQNSFDNKTALIWLTTWDSEKDAQEFLQAFEKINSKHQKFATIYKEKFVFVTKDITPEMQTSFKKMMSKINTKTK
ncbi:tetratricopeptide repeat protein [Candidatus Uabimicrobium sp. HlEnr_7]|uniref:tetratricopeptide repeat protein n=1 Tax=Candidatus Uabimicrobium helgolandensis TaxID=3095367 RepID=UPI003558193B